MSSQIERYQFKEASNFAKMHAMGKQVLSPEFG